MTQSDIINNNFNKVLKCIKSSNAYITGEILNEEKCCKQLIEMKRSTFDVTKFTVVGSPVISDDGIASGFDNSNYIKISTNTDVSLGDYEIDIHFSATGNSVIISTTISNSGNMSLAILKYSGKMMYFLGNGSSWSIAASVLGNTKVIDGTDYVVKLIRTVAGYTFKLLNVATGIEVTDKVIENISNVASLDNLYLGTKSFWGDFTGSTIYNLKEFSVVADGVEIFSGNETGLDIIKADNYTVVGSPTITDDGIVSGCSGSSYIKIPDSNLENANSWKIETLVNVNSGSEGIFGGSFLSGNSVSLTVKNTLDNKLDFFLWLSSASSIGGDIANDIEIEFDYNPTDWYHCVLEFDGKAYSYTIKNLNSGEIKNIKVDSSTKIYQSPTQIGLKASELSSLDLNSFKIYRDGNLVYQPCLRVPYTQSKTGSKIVDSVHRNRVQDVYEQFGAAPYYTLDETNNNFTLPMGEIYGMKADTNLNNLSETGKKVIDGQWVQNVKVLSTAVAVGTYTIDLTDYLPVDDYSYEIYINADAYTGSNEARTYISAMNNDMTTSKIMLLWGASYARQNTNIARVIADKTRKITIQHELEKWSSFNLKAIGYRRLGTNS